MTRLALDAIGSEDHVIGGILFPVLPGWFTEQVARERLEAAREWAALLARTPKPERAAITARIAYLYGWRSRRGQ